MVMIDKKLLRVHIWPVTSHRLTSLTCFISFHGNILSVVTGFYFILVISNSHVCPGVWFQPFDWFRCLQVDCCLCSAVTIRTSPAWSSQTTAAILFLEEKTTWLWCGICPGRSRLNTPELLIVVVVDVCATVWFRWISATPLSHGTSCPATHSPSQTCTVEWWEFRPELQPPLWTRLSR